MSKLPAFQFYPGDWLKDPNLRRCTHAAKGVWMDLLCLMFESEERGVLATAGQAWSDDEIALAVGGDRATVLACVQELTHKGVANRQSGGALYSRRLVRDEHKRRLCVAAGKRGGNPHLISTLNRPPKGEPKGPAKGPPKREPTPSVSSSSSTSVREETHPHATEPAPPVQDSLPHSTDVPAPPHESAQDQTHQHACTETESDSPRRHFRTEAQPDHANGDSCIESTPRDVIDPSRIEAHSEQATERTSTRKPIPHSGHISHGNTDALAHRSHPAIPLRANDPLAAGADWKATLRADAEFVTAWQRWKTHLADPQIAKAMSRSQEDAVLLDAARHGPTRAVDVITFSIRKGAKNLIWDAPKSTPAKPSPTHQPEPPEWQPWLTEHYPDHNPIPYAAAPESVRAEFRRARRGERQ